MVEGDGVEGEGQAAMIKSVKKLGFKLAGEDPAAPPDTPDGASVIRVDIRRERGRARKDLDIELQTFGDGIII